MLDLIRNNSQSLGVKLAFGIIILVFVFWGLGSVQSINNSTTVATVNGEAITVIDFEQAYQQARESVRAQNPQITAEQLKQMQIPQQVMQQLITDALLTEEVKRLQLSVSPQQLRQVILSMPAFQDANGKFDAAVYKNVVDTQFLGAGNFEKIIAQQMSQNALREDITATAQGYTSETEAFFAYTYEERGVDYVFFPAADYLASVEEPAEDSVKAYYESHRAEYSLPAKADVTYIRVHPLELGKPQSLRAEAVKSYYDANQEKFTSPKQFKTRHILLLLPENAPAENVQKITEKMQGIAAEIKNGADFAALAEQHSEDTMSKVNGGSLEWVKAGDTVAPFNDVLMTMTAGQVSDIVRTTFGLHIIKVDEVQEANVQPLAEVEQSIRETLANDAGLGKIREVLDALIEANVLGNDLAKAAQAQGLEVKQSGLKTAVELEKEFYVTPANAAKFLQVAAGVPLDTAVETSDSGYIVARVTAKEESSVRPFAEVQGQIVEILRKDAALSKALEAANQALKGYATTAPEASNVKHIDKVMRGQNVGELGNVPELGTALFAAPKDQWLSSAFAVTVNDVQGAALARVTSVGTASAETWKPMEEILATALTNQRREKMFQLYLMTLSEKAEVKILNQGYLDALMAQ